ncbi:MAG: hypothetical protein WDA09_05405 [Bacteriovoracaceae bacterium]
MDSSNRDMVLIESNDSYFLFSENNFVLYGKFLSDLISDFFTIESVKERVVFEIIDDLGLPKVQVTGGFKFTGKENGNKGSLEGKVAALGMTYFLQRHLVNLLSISEGFSNVDYLDGLISHSSYLKSRTTVDCNKDEEYELYKFWD